MPLLSAATVQEDSGCRQLCLGVYGAIPTSIALFGTDAKGCEEVIARCGPAVVGQVTGTEA